MTTTRTNMMRWGFPLVLLAFGFLWLQGCSGATAEKEAMMEKKASTMEGKMMEGKMTEGKMMEGERTAKLSGAPGHNATGTVAITRDGNGHTLLSMTGLKVDRVPDGRVYLAKNGDYTKGVEVGKLTQFSGTVTFPIPANVRLEEYDSVVIWCRKFDVEIGRAFLGKDGMAAGDAMGAKPDMDKNKGMMKDGGMTK